MNIQNLRFTKCKRDTRGFTMVELLVASGLAGIVMTSFIAGFIQQRVVLKKKNLEQELQFNVRNALSFIEKDLRMAGSGLVMGTGNVDDWFSGISGVSEIPTVYQGTGVGGTDRLITAGFLDAPVAELNGAVAAGTSLIRITKRMDNVYNYQPAVGDVLVIGGVEAVQVMDVVNDYLTIRTDPFLSTAGLKMAYPTGMELFQVNVVIYEIQEADGVKGLVRQDSRYSYGAETDKRIAEEIVDLQIVKTQNNVNIVLTGRTRQPVLRFTGEADGHPRYTLETDVHLRVSLPQVNLSMWDSDLLIATPTPSP